MFHSGKSHRSRKVQRVASPSLPFPVAGIPWFSMDAFPGNIAMHLYISNPKGILHFFAMHPIDSNTGVTGVKSKLWPSLS